MNYNKLHVKVHTNHLIKPWVVQFRQQIKNTSCQNTCSRRCKCQLWEQINKDKSTAETGNLTQTLFQSVQPAWYNRLKHPCWGRAYVRSVDCCKGCLFIYLRISLRGIFKNKTKIMNKISSQVLPHIQETTSCLSKFRRI